MFEMIAMLSVGCIVYLFAKKSKVKAVKRKRQIKEWDFERSTEVKAPQSANQESKSVRPLISDVPIPNVDKEPRKLGAIAHKKSEHLATKTERNFYNTLQKVLPDVYVIHCQVSLMALVQPVNFKDNSRTWAKRMDYVITDSDTKVLAVIELDDSSHRLPKRQERDRYVNDALLGHHPLLRFQAKRQYDPIHIAKVIENQTKIKCNVARSATRYC